MKIKLNDTVSMDLAILIESRLLIQANSGGGKSFAIRRIIEQTFGHVQIIVIDPEGEFGNMRSAYDFVYVGKDGDAPAEPRSAALLARKLLELKASAIIDLYELSPQDRKHFVRLFCEALVNAPKELWHDTLIVIDESHVFAPEKGESESLGAVIDLASRGRKRGFCVALATQRPAKLNKDAAAECNNKLIGRASLDIDRKRSAEELGFSGKEEVRSLRDLEPGEFYTFGPAISRDVRKIKIGDVEVKPAKRGVNRTNPPAPSEKVKNILAQLADLPKEAAEEAKTIQGLQSELRAARGHITRLERGAKEQTPDPDVIKKLTDKAYDLGVSAVETRMRQELLKVQKESADERRRMAKVFNQIAKEIEPFLQEKIVTIELTPPGHVLVDPKRFYTKSPAAPLYMKLQKSVADFEEKIVTEEKKSLSKGALSVLSYLHSVYPHSKSKAQLWIAAGYSPGGGFNNIIYELTGGGFIEKDGSGKYASLEREDMPQLPVIDVTSDKWLNKLSKGAGRIFWFLSSNPDDSFSKEFLANETGYSLGGGFNNLIYELTGKELIIKAEGGYKINPEILEL